MPEDSKGGRCINFSKKISVSHLKILSSSWMTWSKFHTEGPQILGATIRNLVAQATLRRAFVHYESLFSVLR
jgi:hypothetical protein